MSFERLLKKRYTCILMETVLRGHHACLTRMMSIIHFICDSIFAYFARNAVGCFHIGHAACHTHHGNYCVYGVNGI